MIKYGVSASRLKKIINLSLKEAEDIYKKYFEVYSASIVFKQHKLSTTKKSGNGSQRK